MSEEMNHSQRMGRLEEIVRRLEQGGMELDATLDLFEEGRTLLSACRDALTAAEGRIASLTLDEAE